MLEHFFGSKTRLKLLKVFFRSPARAFFVRELSRTVEMQLNAVRREISNLEQMGLIIPSEPTSTDFKDLGTERSKYYRLNTECMLFPELRALLLKTESMEENQLVEEIKSKGGNVKLFLLSGIFTHDAGAETDLLLVGELKPANIGKIIKNYEDILGKTIRYTLMDEKEFKDRREVGDKFLYGLFEAKHLLVVDIYRLG